MKRSKPVEHFNIPTFPLEKMPDEEKTTEKLKAIGSLPRELRNLHTFYNPIANEEEEGRVKIEERKVASVEPPTPTNIDRSDIGSKMLEVEEAKVEHEIAALSMENLPKETLKDVEKIEKEPETFYNAWNHYDPKKRGK